MSNSGKTVKQYYSELEAARYLGISVETLHKVLDEHIFNAEHPRPGTLNFTHAEVLLLSIWAVPEQGTNVLTMPIRN